AAGAGAPRHGALLRANRRLRGGRVAAATGARPVQGFLRTVADRRADTRSERQTGRRTRPARTLQGLTAGRNPGQVSGSAGARHRTAKTTLAYNGVRHLRSQTPDLGGAGRLARKVHAGRDPGQVSGSAGARHRTAETALACKGVRHLRSQTDLRPSGNRAALDGLSPSLEETPQPLRQPAQVGGEGAGGKAGMPAFG